MLSSEEKLEKRKSKTMQKRERDQETLRTGIKLQNISD
jgi:hypothetical protein